MIAIRTEAVGETLLADGEVIRCKRVVEHEQEEDLGAKLIHVAGDAVGVVGI